MLSPFRDDTARRAGRSAISISNHAHRNTRLNRTLAALGAVLSFAGASLARADNGVGAWAPPIDWPIIGIHAVLLPDGRVLSYGTTETGQQTGYTIYDVWDPSTGIHATLPNGTDTDLFCSSQLVLPTSGTVLIAGGDNFVGGATTNSGNNNSNVFTPSTNGLARGNNMNRARWYSSSTTLLNGETYIQGGTSGGDRPEVRGTDGVFRLLSGANTSSYAETFPRNFIAPDGRIFGFDNSGKTYYVVPSGTGSITQVGQLPGATSWTSSAAMFRPGRILQMGGASSAAMVIDINGATPVVTSTQAMSSQRQWVSATILPDGRVLATGGSAVDNALTNVNNSAEVWDPNGNGGTGKWTVGPSGVNARLYHSGALLMPDARVMIIGGGAPGPLVNKNIEMYTPSYLLDPAGNPMPRPSIGTDVPASVEVGQSFSFSYSSGTNISRVTLIKTGSVTHSVNMDQRFVELGFTQNGAVLDVNGPLRATDTPPGYYLLFILNAQGVPSVGKIVRIGVASNPNPTPDATQVMGGTGGSPFSLACNSNEVLAGVYGTSDGTHVNQAGLRCVAVDQSGHWIGSPVNRGVTGVASGASYTKTCPANYAISGYRGRSSTSVDQLDFECRALTSQGKITGVGQYLGTVGGTGGTAQGPYNCGTNNPVYALAGRTSNWLENFGMQCRQAPLTSVNLPPNITNPGTLTGTVGVPVDITIGASDPEGQALTFSATGLPNGLSINAGSGRITGTPTTAGSFSVALTVSDPTTSANAGFTWNINPATSLTLNPLSPPAPSLANTSVTYTASATGSNVRYSWYFDDGTAQTAFSSSPSISHTFAAPGIYYITVTAVDDSSPAQTQTAAQIIYLAATANRPTNSSNMAFEPRSGSNSRIWVVNQDNDTVSAFDAVTNAKLAEIAVGTAPRSIARAPDGRMWVTNKFTATISIINPDTLSVAQTLSLPFASQPYGIAFAPTGGFAYVVLEAAGRVLKLDASSGAQLGTVSVGANPRHVAVSSDGAQLLVSRFITPRLPGEETQNVQTQNGALQYGAEVVRVATAGMTALGTVVLQHSDKADTETQGSGVPNYLGAPTISPDGTSAWVPSKQDNIKRGMLRNGFNLNFQSTVRAISSRIDLGTNAEDYAARLDHDNSSVASAIAFDKYGVYMFVALETSREVAVIDAYGRWEIFRFNVGRAPQGLAVSPDGLKLYVNNFMDRTVGVFDLTRLINFGETNVPALATLQAVTTEKLTAQVLKGKQFFYDARDLRLARDNYLSCATCHNDGGHDGRVWDLTGFGEGLRNTINLRGRAGSQGQGFLHWSGNFDEVQDFEGQIRNLSGGTGLMANTDFNTGTRSQPLGDPKTGITPDLDALAAYVTSLGTFASSPLRNTDGTLSTDAQAGKLIFRDQNCAQCHSGTAFTESGAATLRNIGTIKPSSGQRLGGPLTGIDTPTLRDVWATAPYLHDGSAATLADAVRAHNGVTISDTDLTKLVAYLQQIGGDETAAPSPIIPGLVAAYSFNEGTGTAVADSSSGGNAGTAANTTWTTSGKFGNALVFNGSNARVTIPDSPSLRLTTGMTLEAWVYPIVVDNAWRDVIYKGDDNYYLESSSTNASKLSGGGTFRSAPIYGAAALPINTWSHVAVTYDRANLVLYVNGAQVATGAATANIETSANPLQIGGDTIYGQYFNGRIDEVRVYNRALSAGEVLADMNNPIGGGGGTTDTQAPTVPGSLAASVISSTQINLSWTASTDNVGVSNYLVERCTPSGCSNFAQIGTSNVTTYNNTGLTAATGYSYRVRATDAAGNMSGYSNVVTATTQATPDTVAPTAPSNLGASVISSTQINLSWTASTDNVGVTNYLIERCPTTSCTYAQVGTSTGTTFNNTGLTPSTGYNYRVRATDAANNLSGYSNVVSATTLAPPDTTAPTITITAPTNQATWSVSATPLILGGTAADNVAVTQVTWSNDRGGSGTATGMNNWSINPGVTLQSGANVITVTARDAANNVGTDSLTVTYTPPPDTTPPQAPAGLGATAASSSQINLSWTAATDDVGVTGYFVERCQGAGCSNFGQIATPTATSFLDTNLSATTSYSYRVRARDAANNLSGYSNVATAVTQAQPTGLVAAYAFNEGTGTAVTDASGLGNAGTAANTTWTTAGKNGAALVFNGSNARVTIPDSASLRLTAGMTLEAWVYPIVSDSSWRDIIYKGEDIYYLEASSTNAGRPSGGGTFRSAPIYGTAALPVNTWSHVAVTYDKANLRLYVNGTQVATATATANIEVSANPLQIGGDTIYGQYFNGRIDDVRVYNRALSATELQTDMNTPVGP